MYGAYDIPSDEESQLDHLIPLQLGGSNDITNLWIEVGSTPNPKDSLETWLKHKVCIGKMTLLAARSAIVTDWTSAG
jgi:hypothetical protein